MTALQQQATLSVLYTSNFVICHIPPKSDPCEHLVVLIVAVSPNQTTKKSGTFMQQYLNDSSKYHLYAVKQRYESQL